MQLTRSLSRFFYQTFAKPIFFSRDAEDVHNMMTALGSTFGQTSAGRQFVKTLFAYHNPNLTKKIDGITFPNPIGLSAGFDYNAQLTQILPSVGFGFATVGTVTLEPYEGNTPPRLGRFPRSQALLVNKGFKSKGAPAIIKQLENKKFNIPIGISIGSTNKTFPSVTAQIEDIFTTFTLFEQSTVQHSYYELNISCPNTQVGQPFTDTKNLTALLKKISTLKLKKPVYLKMPIDLPEEKVLELLHTANNSFISGVIFGNLTKDKQNPAVHPQDQILWKTRKGNLSGKPTWERSNNLIRLTKKYFHKRFTIIGTGGVFSGEDAAEKINLGADLVQLITGMIYQGPQLIGDINAYLAEKTTD